MKIFVRGLDVLARHGVYEEERLEGRRFSVDMEVVLSDETSTTSDNLSDTLDYREIASVILDVANGESHDLVEWLAAEMMRRIFERSRRVISARVEIRKFATGVPGDPACVGVELSTTREAFEQSRSSTQGEPNKS